MQDDPTAARGNDRLAQLERALEEALAERNRLWHDAQRAQALEEELEQMRTVLRDITGSPSWRITAPLRAVKESVTVRAGRYGALARKARARLRD